MDLTRGKTPQKRARVIAIPLTTVSGAVFLDLGCWLGSAWGFLEVLDSAEPVRYPVPTGDVLVHQPPLMIHAEVAHHSADLSAEAQRAKVEGATVGLSLMNELRLASQRARR